MPLALWTLLWLNFRAGLRKIRRQMRTWRGILFSILGICVLAVWLVPSIFLNGRLRTANAGAANTLAPVVILLMTVLNLVSSAGERAVTFTPAEIDFLFPGPFSRRQLLCYKLLKTALATIVSALLFGVVLGRYGGTYVCRVVGVWLLFQFLQLLAMVIALLQTTIGERMVTTGRRAILLLLGGASVLAILPVLHGHFALSRDVIMDATRTTTGRIVLRPFKVFARALLAPRFLFDGLIWSSVAACIDLVLATVVVALDSNFLETSAIVSARRYDRLARLRRSGLVGMANAKSSRWKIPMLPWLAGTGPILWRQMTTDLRAARTLVMILLLLAIGLGILISKSGSEGASIGSIVGISVYLNLIVSKMLRFDFSGDLDHMDVLRSLPLSGTSVALAQLTTPVFIISAIQLTLLTTIAVTGRLPTEHLAGIVAFAVPLNFLSVGLDNLLFLLFPFRAQTAVAGDMTLVGRQAIVFACRLFLMVIVAGVAVGIGAATWALTGRSVTVAAAVAWLPLAGAVAAIVWLTGWAYSRFDPSISTPVGA